MAEKKKNLAKPDLKEVLEELQSRFLMNLPPSELESSERLFFQIEQCYWFYEDFYADHYKHLQHMKLNDFAKEMFHSCILLQPLKHKCDEMFDDFKAYQHSIPVVGCIMLNKEKTKILLVRNWKGTSWTFPRGKINQGETDIECAQRESLEECGFDASGLIIENQYLEFYQTEQRVRMYLISGVPEDYPFAPQTRKEISLIQMFPLNALPKKTWCVTPFMGRLRRWVAQGGKNTEKKALPSPVNESRAVSAPKKRPPSRKSMSIAGKIDNRSKSRGHFGSERETTTSNDSCNDVTFGQSTSKWSVEEMFRVNENLTGQKFSYSGNPNEFGNSDVQYKNRIMSLKTSAAESHQEFAAPVAALFSSSLANSNNSSASTFTSSLTPTIITSILKAPDKMLEEDQSSQKSDDSKNKRKSDQNVDALSAFTFDTVDIMACVT